MSVWFWVVIGIMIVYLVKGKSLATMTPNRNFLSIIPSVTNWSRPLLILGAVGIFYAVFFTNLSVKVFEWDWATTPLGGKLEEKFGEGSSWLLWLVIAVVALVAWSKFGPKKSLLASSSSGTFTTFIDQIIIFVVVAVASAVVVAVAWIILGLFGHTETIEAAITGTGKKSGGVVAECTTNKTSMDFRVDAGGRDVTICRGGNSFFLIPIYGHELQFEISPKFKRENEHLLTNRNLDDFVNVQLPRTFPGSTQESYRILPTSSIGNEYVSAFDRSGLDRIVLNVKAVPRYRK